MHDGGVIKVPMETLSPDALAGVIDEFINREGTDYGHRDFTLDEKRRHVRAQLACGEAVITFDPRTATTSVVPAHEMGADDGGPP